MYKKVLTTIALISSIALTLNADGSYKMDYDKETTCLVRNLKVHKDPRWVSKIELTNGKKIFFSSPKSMIEFYQIPGKWFDVGVKSEDDFKLMLVTDFDTLKPIDAKGAFYVYGANETSPAGDDLVPFATFEAAKSFASKHNGKRVLAFNQVSNALIRLLNGKI